MAQHNFKPSKLALALFWATFFLVLFSSGAGWRNFGPFMLAISVGIAAAALLSNERAGVSISNLAHQAIIVFLALIATCIFLWLDLQADGTALVVGTIGWSWLAPIIAHSFLVAVMEEMQFRRYLLDFLLRRWSNLGAIVGSSTIFYIVHFTFSPTVLIAGLVWAFLTVRYRSLVAAVALHTLDDSTMYVGRFYQKSDTQLESGMSLYVAITGAVVLASLAIALICLLWGTLDYFITRHRRKLNFIPSPDPRAS